MPSRPVVSDKPSSGKPSSGLVFDRSVKAQPRFVKITVGEHSPCLVHGHGRFDGRRGHHVGVGDSGRPVRIPAGPESSGIGSPAQRRIPPAVGPTVPGPAPEGPIGPEVPARGTAAVARCIPVVIPVIASSVPPATTLVRVFEEASRPRVTEAVHGQLRPEPIGAQTAVHSGALAARSEVLIEPTSPQRVPSGSCVSGQTVALPD